MRKLIVSERVSLDGVFDADTMAQWSFPYATDEVISVIKAGLMRSDIYLLGRTTYNMLAPGWAALKHDTEGPGERLYRMHKVVVSSTLKKADADVDWGATTFVNDHVAEAINQLKAQPGQDIIVHGSATLVQSLMQANLVDEYEFIVFPVIVGKGKRFFNEAMHVEGLALTRSQPLGRGVVVCNYQRQPPS